MSRSINKVPMHIAFFFLGFALLMLSACTTTNDLSMLESGYSGISNQDKLEGDYTSKLMQARFKLISDHSLEKYVISISDALLKNTNLHSVDAHYFIADHSELFAYAIPNGDIFISKGILAMAENEAELASVVAHELGHLLLQHAKKSRELEDNLQGKFSNLDTDTEADGKQLYRTFSSVINYGNSREQEVEADRVMIQLLERSDYNVNSAYTMFKKLAELLLSSKDAEGDLEKTHIYDTHPHIVERLSTIRSMADDADSASNNMYASRYRVNVLGRYSLQ